MQREIDRRPVVVVADDDEIQQFLFEEALEEAGFEAHMASNGAEAVEQAERVKPDIVLLDVMMPVMDGFTACERLRQTSGLENIPVLMVTGADDAESIARARQVGATDLMPKPIDWTVIGERLHEVHRAAAALTP